MNAQHVNQVAMEIYDQIRVFLPLNYIYSWGISEQRATTFRNMASLAMKVNGYQHKGWVVISLNEGKDLYEIFLLDWQHKVIKSIEDVYCEDLEILDTLIESGDLSTEEYNAKVNRSVFVL